MSGLFKSIGKVFKKVIKVVKKIALPALAIAAVIVTGGAALGLIPAIGGMAITGLGTLASALGASSAVAGILSTAATGATIGMIGGFLTSGNLKGAIKGASMGFLTGGVLGGLGQIVGGIGGAVGGAGTAAPGVIAETGAAAGFTPVGMTSGALEGAIGASGASSVTGALASAAPAAAAAGSGGGGGILGFLSQNPLLASGLLKGIGGALAGNPDMDIYKARQKSYEGVIPYKPHDWADPSGLPRASDHYNSLIYGQSKYEYDHATGRIVPAKPGS